MEERITAADIRSLKGRRKITMLTAYDYPLAELIDRCGIDIVLVGDSLANVVLGLESTREVGMNEMLHHAKAVRRAVKRSLLVGDMPYSAYQPDPGLSLMNAERFVKEAGCEAVKVEWFSRCLEAVKDISACGIPVMGHIGLTPQRAEELGGFKVQGKTTQDALSLIEQAIKLQDAGCFSLVLECVPDKVAELITRKLSIPTIGIGAGVFCDGQVLVTPDLLGTFGKYRPKFVKAYAELSGAIKKAIEEYKSEVLKGEFPDAQHSFSMNGQEFEKLKKQLEEK